MMVVATTRRRMYYRGRGGGRWGLERAAPSVAPCPCCGDVHSCCHVCRARVWLCFPCVLRSREPCVRGRGRACQRHLWTRRWLP